ncbi:hypothetical protein PsorP6_014650 [Peronosclerospora sorghi]|uniref:Uncharacterized protein n=1 Tax=Peronosclerospora sorghi TaxID=230839 RepID=A0ACC0VTI1_9STRA|nr:hypothetical protein PsorP6_014650 [Peronosclerospora sorghi]
MFARKQLITHLHFIFRNQLGNAVNVIDLRFLQIPFVDPIQSLDVRVAFRLHASPIKVAKRKLPRGSGNTVVPVTSQMLHMCRSVVHDLFRDAPEMNACTTEPHAVILAATLNNECLGTNNLEIWRAPTVKATLDPEP